MELLTAKDPSEVQRLGLIEATGNQGFSLFDQTNPSEVQRLGLIEAGLGPGMSC